MGTPTYPRRTIARVKKAVRDLHFVAYYQCSEEWVNDCMHDYADRAIVYILASKHEGQEYILYVGKTQAQYTRFIKHSSHYEYDTIYLFECAPELLDKCEAAVIKALWPSVQPASQSGSRALQNAVGYQQRGGTEWNERK